MFLTAPLWLTLLVPWAGLLAWALVGRRPAVDVPFVQLWRGPAAAAVPPRRRGRRRPPAPVVLVLLAVLLAVLAAAGPRWDAGGGRITLIVDRGASASGRVGGDVRYRAAMRDLATALPRGTTVHVSTVPAGVQSTGDAGGLAMLAPAIAPTAVDTRAAIFAAATSVTAPAIAITDAPLPDRHGLFRIPPPPPGEDVAITSFAARAAPRPQVMVRVRNDSAATTARLTVRSGTVTTAVDVPLPPRGQSKRYFIDLPALAETVEAALADGDATEANDAAYLAAGTAWARPEPRGPLPSMVADVLAAYARARSPTARSTTVAIITDAGQLSPTAPAVLLPEPTGPPLPATVDPTVADDPLVRDVDWAAALSGATLATPPDQQAFVPLVRVGPRPAVAVTRADPRRVWVGFRSPAWARTPAFPIFWTNVLDAFGGPGKYTSVPAQQLGPGWTRLTPGPDTEAGYWPGLYRRGDGAARAVNAADVPAPAPAGDVDWRAALRARPWITPGGGTRLAGPLLIAALAALLVAAALARGRA